MNETQERISEKISDIKLYLEELESIGIPEFEEYKKDIKTKAICERYFEKVIEAVISATVLVIKEKELKSPETEEQAFFILAKSGIIRNELAES